MARWVVDLVGAESRRLFLALAVLEEEDGLSDDDAVLGRIDATIEGLCACGCGIPLRADGPSAFWATDRCLAAWQGRQAERPHEVYQRPDAHMQYIPPAEFPLPVDMPDGPGSPDGYSRGRWVREQARLLARMEERRPSSSRLEELRQAMVEHLHAVLNMPEEPARCDGQQRAAWPEELIGEVLTEMQLASSDGRRWQITPGRGARAEVSINRWPWNELLAFGRPAEWLEADRQQTTVTVTWTGPWELRVSEGTAGRRVSAENGRG